MKKSIILSTMILCLFLVGCGIYVKPINQTLNQTNIDKCNDYDMKIDSIMLEYNNYSISFTNENCDIYYNEYTLNDMDVINLDGCIGINKINIPNNNQDEVFKFVKNLNDLSSKFKDNNCLILYNGYPHFRALVNFVDFYCNQTMCIRKINDDGECEYFDR